RSAFSSDLLKASIRRINGSKGRCGSCDVGRAAHLAPRPLGNSAAQKGIAFRLIKSWQCFLSRRSEAGSNCANALGCLFWLVTLKYAGERYGCEQFTSIIHLSELQGPLSVRQNRSGT